jgi:hypothetical protein
LTWLGNPRLSCFWIEGGCWVENNRNRCMLKGFTSQVSSGRLDFFIIVDGAIFL